MSDKLTDIKESILSFPDKILDKIKEIFIPDVESINESFNGFLDDLKMKFNYDTSAFESLFNASSPVEDKKENYNIYGLGSFNLTFFDSDPLKKGVEFFRPIIRGFLVLLMLFYNVKMMLSFIRQDSGVVTGKIVSGGKNE